MQSIDSIETYGYKTNKDQKKKKKKEKKEEIKCSNIIKQYKNDQL